MSDRDYGCNAESPEGIIAVILDDAGRAKEILKELDGLGFAIVPKEPTSDMICGALQASLDLMKEAGVTGLSPFSDYPAPGEITKRCYRAMVKAAHG